MNRPLSRVLPAMIVVVLALGHAARGQLPAEVYLSTLDPANGGDGSAGVVFTAATPEEFLGSSVAAGDVDGDGVADVVIGGLGDSPCLRCAAFVAYGRDDFPPSFDLIRRANESDGQEAFIIGSRARDDLGGSDLRATVDLNGDSLADLLVGARFADNDVGNAGEVAVLFGSGQRGSSRVDVADLLERNGGDGSQGVIFSGWDFAEGVGTAIAGPCDVNGDGVHDVVFGAPEDSEGQMHIVYGRPSGFPPEFGLARLLPSVRGDGREGVFVQEPFDSSAGTSAACAGDVNADGFDDLLLGSGGDRNGGVYLLYGRADFPPELDLIDLLRRGGGDGAEGTLFKTDGGGFLGVSVTGGGDFNGDGIDDIAFGAPPTSNNASGNVYVVYGRAEGYSPEYLINRLFPAANDGSQGLVITGLNADDDVGAKVSFAGDVNGDGLDDLLIGAPLADSPAGLDVGAAFLVYGQQDPDGAVLPLVSLLEAGGGDGSRGVVFFGEFNGSDTGVGLAAGDVNGDGRPDVLIGAPSARSSGVGMTGKAYVVYGQAAAD